MKKLKLSTIIKLVIISPVYLFILMLQIQIVVIEIVMVIVTMISFDSFIKQYARRQLLAVDQVINAIMFGDEDETISGRAGRKWDGTWWSRLINFIFHWQRDHCVNAIEEDEGYKDMLYPKV